MVDEMNVMDCGLKEINIIDEVWTEENQMKHEQ